MKMQVTFWKECFTHDGIKQLLDRLQKLASKGKPDPLGLFKDLTPEARVSVGETIDEYIANAKTEDDIAVLEAYKIFVGIIND